MGNDSSSSSSPAINSSIHSGNNSFAGGLLGHFDAASFWWQIFSMMSMEEIMHQCQTDRQSMVWIGIISFFLMTGILANAGLTWILLSSKKPLSHSEVLALNLSVLDLLSCLCYPLEIYKRVRPVSEQLSSASEALSMPKVFGCPLLLVFMCVERYLAVGRPVAYIKLGKRQYRAALCACAWIATLAVALSVYFLGVHSMILYLAVTLYVLFQLMLLCLVGIVRVLRRGGPGEGSANSVPLRRRAMKNVLAVMVPALVAYSPVVLLVPFIAVIKSQYDGRMTPKQCDILHVFLVFPNFGIYIGPMFYLSRVRQLLCLRRNEKRREQTTASFKTQAE